MKRKHIYIGMLSIFTNIAVLNAQEYIDKTIRNENGTISLVTFKPSIIFKNKSTENIVREILKLDENTKLFLKETNTVGKLSDEKYKISYKDIPVDFASFTLHYTNNGLTSISSGLFSTENIITTTPSISAEKAFQNAINSVGAEKYMWEDLDYNATSSYKKPKAELVFVPIQVGNNAYSLFLAYKFDIYAAEPLSRSEIYVDALEGRIILTNAIMKHSAQENKKGKSSRITIPKKNNDLIIMTPGNADTRYSGSKTIETTQNNDNFLLKDNTRGNGIHTFNLKKSQILSSAVDFTDDDNNWTATEYNNANYDNAALDAHWGVEKTYDYFKDTFNRNSYDNQGALLKSYVHYGMGYDNAAWTGEEMVYGDGGGMFKPLTALDITAHELGHAVNQSTASSTYERESGAINEALSDIWASIVEHKYAPEKQAFLIGEEITNNSPGYLRSMSNPKSGLTPQPDTYRGNYWTAATVEEGCTIPDVLQNDYCGVHTNSGILNHWFYILVSGKSGTNDINHSYQVNGIGWEKAAEIVYRLETAYLTSNANYLETRNFAIQTANDLYGQGSDEAIAVQDAFYAFDVR